MPVVCYNNPTLSIFGRSAVSCVFKPARKRARSGKRAGTVPCCGKGPGKDSGLMDGSGNGLCRLDGSGAGHNKGNSKQLRDGCGGNCATPSKKTYVNLREQVGFVTPVIGYLSTGPCIPVYQENLKFFPDLIV